jgi:Na+:H+ antiporter, NhaA family
MPIPINVRSFKEFFSSNSAGGIILIICVIISLCIANSSWNGDFEKLLASSIGIKNEYINLQYSVLNWINDALMAIFFLLIGLEIKRELMEGELSSVQKASLPVLAAFGGAIIPAIIFFITNRGTEVESGWGIPMATDIAFALAVISLLGSRVPASLKIFLAALAIVDDLIAILVIAIFYSNGLHIDYLFYALAIVGFLFVLNRLGVRSLWAYILPGMFIWYFIHHSGIHATIAGVLTAMTIPTTIGRRESPLEKLEHILHRPVNFIIMPVFALANTNISFEDTSISMLGNGLSIGIIAGLLVGKPIGIMLFSWLAVTLKVGVLPADAKWSHIFGLGIVGGIGFTMSIFIALLSFDNTELQIAAKFAVLITSAIAGLTGYLLLSLIGNKPTVSSR